MTRQVRVEVGTPIGQFGIATPLADHKLATGSDRTRARNANDRALEAIDGIRTVRCGASRAIDGAQSVMGWDSESHR